MVAAAINFGASYYAQHLLAIVLAAPLLLIQSPLGAYRYCFAVFAPPTRCIVVSFQTSSFSKSLLPLLHLAAAAYHSYLQGNDALRTEYECPAW
jgi:hypothetical protein